MGDAIYRSIREEGPPPCFYTGEQCRRPTAEPVTQIPVESLSLILSLNQGALIIVEDRIKPDIESRWEIDQAETEDMLVETETQIEPYSNDDTSTFCNKMHIVYERLNGLAHYIEILKHQERGALSSIFETDLKGNFVDLQREIYRCMCEIKLLLRLCNCDPCSQVPHGRVSAGFQSKTASESGADQQLAAFWVVLKCVEDLSSIATFLRLTEQTLSN